MESVVYILMLFIAINTLLKLSYLKWWQVMAFSLVCCVFIVVSCRYAVMQSKTELADYLLDGTIIQNAAVMISLESVVCILFCFTTLGSTQRKRGRLWLRILNYYPGLLIFPVLFYLLTQLIYAMPGTGFAVISYVSAAGVLVAIPVLTAAIRRLCAEKELRLEVHFLVSLFVCIIGLIATVNGNMTYMPAREPLNVRAIILSAGLFAVTFLSGIILHKLKWKMFNNKKIKN